MDDNTYKIPIRILFDNGIVATPENIVLMDIALGTITKAEPQITFDYDTGAWLFPVEESELSILEDQETYFKIRVRAKNSGDILTTLIHYTLSTDSLV